MTEERAFCQSEASVELREVPVCPVGASAGVLRGADGLVYRELESNIWVDSSSFEQATVLYEETGSRSEGTFLKPLFRKVQGVWRNIETGQPAPFRFFDSQPNVPAEPCEKNDARVLAHLDWEQKCDALLSICESFHWARSLEEAYQHACDAVADIVACDEAHLHIKSVDGTRYIKCAYHLKGPKMCEWDDNHPATVGRMQWMLEVRRPIIMDYEHPHFADKIPLQALETGVKSAVTIPLQASGEVVGTCSAVYRRRTEWSREDEEFLLLIGREVGTFIKRLQDTKKATELEILDERRRLSGEIHDNVSTLIGSLSLYSAAARSALDEGDVTAARRGLAKLEGAAVEAMRVLRDEIISLRLPLEKDDGFLEAVEDLLVRYEQSWGIKTDLDISGFCRDEVPLEASMHLMRILNECLSNTLRHAEARNVKVRLESNALGILLVASDDGRGFDVRAVDPERFGLKIMQERAATIGGSVRIESGSNGTTVRVVVPLSAGAR